jgi:hypothetical protein
VAGISPGNLFSRIGVHNFELCPLDTVGSQFSEEGEAVVCKNHLSTLLFLIAATLANLPAASATTITDDGLGIGSLPLIKCLIKTDYTGSDFNHVVGPKASLPALTQPMAQGQHPCCGYWEVPAYQHKYQ